MPNAILVDSSWLALYPFWGHDEHPVSGIQPTPVWAYFPTLESDTSACFPLQENTLETIIPIWENTHICNYYVQNVIIPVWKMPHLCIFHPYTHAYYNNIHSTANKNTFVITHTSATIMFKMSLFLFGKCHIYAFSIHIRMRITITFTQQLTKTHLYISTLQNKNIVFFICAHKNHIICRQKSYMYFISNK